MNAQEIHLNNSALNGNILSAQRIRTTALGVFLHNDRIFVAELHDPIKGEIFYRPLGGGIEFGERGCDALVREMREEAGLQIVNVQYLGAVENIFTYLGEMGHEIVMLYEAEFADQSVYSRDVIECCEANDEPFIGVWKRLDEFGSGAPPLYPDGPLPLQKRNYIC